MTTVIIFLVITVIAIIIRTVSSIVDYRTVKAKERIFESATKDLETMRFILDKFKREEMPLDAEIIEKHFKLFDLAEQSFESKMKIYEDN